MRQHILISELKMRQDELDARKRALKEVFIPFRDGLCDGLQQHIEKAKGEGLHGAEALKREHDSHEYLEATFTLDGIAWILIATDIALPTQRQPEHLAMKVFLYLGGSDDRPPDIEILVAEGREGDYYARGWVLVITDPQPLSIGRGKPVDSDLGRSAAKVLLGYFHTWLREWPQKVTLGQIRERLGSDAQKIGFPLPPRNGTDDPGA